MKWISIKDRLPPLKDNSKEKDSYSDWVLALENDGEIYIAQLCFVSATEFVDKFEYFWDLKLYGYTYDFNPTHWMKLPKLPSEGVHYPEIYE